jgi:hypothetical protein
VIIVQHACCAVYVPYCCPAPGCCTTLPVTVVRAFLITLVARLKAKLRCSVPVLLLFLHLQQFRDELSCRLHQGHTPPGEDMPCQPT